MTEKGLIVVVTINGTNVKYYRRWNYSEEEGCFEPVLTDHLQKAHIFLSNKDGKNNSKNIMEEIMIYYKDEFGDQIAEKVTVEVKEITLVV